MQLVSLAACIQFFIPLNHPLTVLILIQWFACFKNSHINYENENWEWISTHSPYGSWVKFIVVIQCTAVSEWDDNGGRNVWESS